MKRIMRCEPATPVTGLLINEVVQEAIHAKLSPEARLLAKIKGCRLSYMQLVRIQSDTNGSMTVKYFATPYCLTHGNDHGLSVVEFPGAQYLTTPVEDITD